MLWRFWLVSRKSIRPVKYLSYEVLAWLSVWSKVQMTCIWSSWCQCHPIISASEKSRMVCPSGTRLPCIVLEKSPLTTVVVVVVVVVVKYCITVCRLHQHLHRRQAFSLASKHQRLCSSSRMIGLLIAWKPVLIISFNILYHSCLLSLSSMRPMLLIVCPVSVGVPQYSASAFPG